MRKQIVNRSLEAQTGARAHVAPEPKKPKNKPLRDRVSDAFTGAVKSVTKGPDLTEVQAKIQSRKEQNAGARALTRMMNSSGSRSSPSTIKDRG